MPSERIEGKLAAHLAELESSGGAKGADDGTMTLMFSDRPLILRQWRVEDGQGQRTTVTLDKIEIGVELSAELFEVPDKYNQVGRGEN